MRTKNRTENNISKYVQYLRQLCNWIELNKEEIQFFKQPESPYLELKILIPNFQLIWRAAHRQTVRGDSIRYAARTDELIATGVLSMPCSALEDGP